MTTLPFIQGFTGSPPPLGGLIGGSSGVTGGDGDRGDERGAIGLDGALQCIETAF